MMKLETVLLSGRRSSRQVLAVVTALMCLVVLLPSSLAVASDEAPQVEVFDVTRHRDYDKAKSERLRLYVSTRIIDMKADEKPAGYIPLIIGLWNHKAKPFYVDLGRIRLFDRYGNELPMADLEEVRRDYPHLRRDQQHREFTSFGGRFNKGSSRLVPTDFFPPPGTVRVTTAQVHRHRRIKDLVYFKGTMAPDEPYKLEITLRKSGEVLVIPFRSR